MSGQVRFDALFTLRWNAAWMMAKHIFEGQDPLQCDFTPVSLVLQVGETRLSLY